jgi:SAM-dependent methyltransferase
MAFAHARRIAAYNARLYVAAAVGILAGAAVIAWPGIPPALRWTAAGGIVVAVWFSCASFWAFHAMFDRSELLKGTWVRDEVASPRRWVLINAGLDQTTVPLREVFPDASGKELDIYDPACMTEPALTRARELKGEGPAATARPDALPVENGGADLVVVMLAAHEIRDAGARDRFFGELRRVVSSDGRVVLVEHLRNLSAALAFGPGMFHFYPRGMWLGLAAKHRLEPQLERSMTPWVRVFTFRPGGS